MFILYNLPTDPNVDHWLRLAVQVDIAEEGASRSGSQNQGFFSNMGVAREQSPLIDKIYIHFEEVHKFLAHALKGISVLWRPARTISDWTDKPHLGQDQTDGAWELLVRAIG